MKILMLALTSLALLSTGVAQQNFVMNTGNTPNCTTFEKAKGFDVNFFSIGGTDSISIGAPSGGGAGKLQLGPLVIHKNFDTCSESLLKSFLSSKSAKTITLTEYRTTEGESLAVMQITLTDSFITNYQITNVDTRASSEVINFNYTQACISNTTQNSDGSAGTKTTVCYDVVRNMVF
jgi:type VI protein secretion system component Hcp